MASSTLVQAAVSCDAGSWTPVCTLGCFLKACMQLMMLAGGVSVPVISSLAWTCTVP